MASGFSAKHLHSTAKKLKTEVNKLNIPGVVNKPSVLGSKSDSWLLVVVKEVQVHFLLEEYRYDLDLEFRWLNPPPKEMINKSLVVKWLRSLLQHDENSAYALRKMSHLDLVITAVRLIRTQCQLF